MKTQLTDDNASPTPKSHTIRLHFDDTPEDQALYAALVASSKREDRNPVSRQIKFQLKIANAIMENLPPPSTRLPARLRLIPGGAEAPQSE